MSYFRYQLERSNLEFFQRIGYKEFKGKTVLDVGCGHGALSIEMARLGAKRVVGVDIDKPLIEEAVKTLKKNYPEYASVVQFECASIESINEKFDIAISKDSFEHINDLPTMMHNISERLEANGLLIAGFSPLYFSPFGDHGRYLGWRRSIPWLPVLLPEPLLFRLASHIRKTAIRSAADVGLNKLTPQQFRKIISDQCWVPVSLEYNKGERSGMALMRQLRKFPFLEKFFTVNIYAQLRAPRNNLA